MSKLTKKRRESQDTLIMLLIFILVTLLDLFVFSSFPWHPTMHVIVAFGLAIIFGAIYFGARDGFL